MDTYMDLIKDFYYINDTVLKDAELGKEYSVLDFVWQSSIINKPYFYDIEKMINDYINSRKK